MKNKKHVWVAGAMCVLPLMGMAQQTEPLTDSRRLFDDGKELFLRRDYAAAQQTLSRFVQQKPQASLADEAAYMIACTSYELKSPDCIKQLEGYLEQYPDSRYANRVQSLIASAYFFQEKYPEAIACFKGCQFDLLADSERDACTLRMGTAYLKMGNLQEAAVWFSILKEVSSEYHIDAVYHLAYIDYVQKQYDKALQGFREAGESSKYAALSPYYIADIHLVRGNYQHTRQIASTYLEAYPRQEKAIEMKRICGEACYGLKQYAAAIDYLSAYRSETEEHAERNSLYKLGMSFFHTGSTRKQLLHWVR